MSSQDLISAPAPIAPPKRRWIAAVRGDSAAWRSFALDYSLPIYGWMRASGCEPAAALKRTSGFLAWAEPIVAQVGAQPARGFLLGQFDAYMKAGGPTEGGDAFPVPDAEGAEAKVQSVVSTSPEMAYAKLWTRTVLESTLETVRLEYEAAGKGELFPHLRGFLAYQMGNEDPYVKVAPAAGVSVSGLRLAVFNFRQRYKDALRDIVIDTLVSDDGTDEEITALLCAAA